MCFLLEAHRCFKLFRCDNETVESGCDAAGKSCERLLLDRRGHKILGATQEQVGELVLGGRRACVARAGPRKLGGRTRARERALLLRANCLHRDNVIFARRVPRLLKRRRSISEKEFIKKCCQIPKNLSNNQNNYPTIGGTSN